MGLKRWYIDSFPDRDTQYDLLEAEAEKETIVLSIVVSNYSSENITAWVRYMVGTTEAMKWLIHLDQDSAPFALDTKMVFTPGDKITVETSHADVAVWASGDAS